MTAAEGQRGIHPNPYIGPRPFRRTDADRFFGRGREARDVKSAWIGDPVTVLHGPTAVGKTSLLQAGVLPALEQQPRAEVLPVGGFGHEPPVRLAEPPSYTRALLARWAGFGEPPEPGSSVTSFLRSHVSRAQEPGGLVLAAIDHFEELFTSFPAREKERANFIDDLATALREVPELRLLLVINDEHMASLDAYGRRLSPFPLNRMELAALSEEATLEAVTRPLTETNRSFGIGVAESLVERLRTVEYTDLVGQTATLRTEQVEPLLLQIVCASLWASLPPGAEVITTELLSGLGDADQAIARFYDAAMRAVHMETRQPEELLRDWIDSTFITDHGTRGTACRGLLETAGMPNRVADAFLQERLLATEYRSRSTWYQLGHDRMIIPIRRSNDAWRAAHGVSAVAPPNPLTPATPGAFRRAADAALAAGNFDTASRFADHVIEGYRESGESLRLGQALTQRASIARTAGNLLAAEGFLQDALSQFSQLADRDLTARTLAAIAQIHFDRHDYRAARDFNRNAVEELPSYIDAIIGLGYAQWCAGSPTDAEATFTLALGRGSGSARASGGRGQVLAEMREYGAALVDLDPALATAELPLDEEIDVRSARALSLAGVGRLEDANTELAVARSLAPGRARTQRRAAWIAAMRGQNDLALAEAQLALNGSPPLPPWDEGDARRLIEILRRRGLYRPTASVRGHRPRFRTRPGPLWQSFRTRPGSL
jgi:tetratricopeptide (TPR) repeat protein